MRPLIAGNWKENCTIKEAIALSSGIKKLAGGIKDADVVICPPFTALKDVSISLKGTRMMLGAQDVFYEDNGAFTGEISPMMLKELCCEFVIVGHSERREYFMETDMAVNRKIKACLKHGLTPIMCVGETEQEKKEGITKKVIEREMTQGLEDISKKDAGKIVIAYEPIWAIGTGLTATPEQAQEMHAYIRQLLSKMFGESAKKVRILYGGSVKPENTKELMKQKDIDGALVGGASLKAESFAEIIKRSA